MNARWVRNPWTDQMFHLLRPRNLPFLSVFCQADIQIPVEFSYDPPDSVRCGVCQERASGEYR